MANTKTTKCDWIYTINKTIGTAYQYIALDPLPRFFHLDCS